MTPGKEIAAGIVVFRKTKEGPKFLVLYHGHNYWNFAKGKIENEEKSLEAAFRETQEETGLEKKDLRLVRNFKVHERFSFRRGNQQIFKIVIFYLAETREEKIKLSSEHEGYGWFLCSEAKRILGKYKDSQRVLKQSFDFLKNGERRRTPDRKKSAPVQSQGIIPEQAKRIIENEGQ
jgi:bis(5'-nucleosidyl)-tetraphosphatase